MCGGFKKPVKPVAKFFQHGIAGRRGLQVAEFAVGENLRHCFAFLVVARRGRSAGIGLGQVMGQARLGVLQQLAGGARRRRHVLRVRESVCAGDGCDLGLAFFFIRGVFVLRFREQHAQPPVAHQAPLGIRGFGEGNTIVGPNQCRVTGFHVARLGAGLYHYSQGQQMRTVLAERRLMPVAGRLICGNGSVSMSLRRGQQRGKSNACKD